MNSYEHTSREFLPLSVIRSACAGDPDAVEQVLRHYASTKSVAQQSKTAKRPAAFEEQHRAELTAYRAAAAYFKANDITKLPSPKKLEAEYAQLASEKAKFYEQYKEAKEELLKLKTAKQNVASFFREEEPAQQER